jgi:membrane complex biogenesis BtpA family protein
MQDYALPQPLLVGMIHLPPLPGSPVGPDESVPCLDRVIEHALRDARTLESAGFECVIVENFGDAPFTAGSIPPASVASMAIVVYRISRETNLTVGVNCLRNDARSALGVAAATGASIIRVNVHTGVAATDQGIIEGRAFDTLRERDRLQPMIGIWADVHVKHAKPLNQPDIALAAEETAYRGQADAVIVSGTTTGRPADRDALAKVKAAVADKPVLVGSGASADTIAELLRIADGAIVGSALKVGGDIAAPIDAALAAAFIDAARV